MSPASAEVFGNLAGSLSQQLELLMASFAWAVTLGRVNMVLNPEIVYKCKSDKNPPPNTPIQPTFICVS